MGRNLAMAPDEVFAPIQADTPQNRNDVFMGQKPVWMYYGVNVTMADVCLTFFGSNMEVLNQASTYNSNQLSHPKNTIAATLNALTQTEYGVSYLPYGHSSSQASSSSLSPHGGAHGPCLFGQTVAHAGVMFNSVGNVKLSYPSNYQGCGERVYGGCVVGEQGYKQGISLNCHNQFLTLHAVGSYPASSGLTSSEYGGFDYTANNIMDSSGSTSNYGAVGYNRNTNTLVLLQYLGSNTQFRLHKWTDLPKLSLDNSVLKEALIEAKASGRYSFVDLTLDSVSDDEWRYRATLFPTDDGGVWITKKGASSGLYVYAILQDDSVQNFGVCSAPTTHYTYSNANYMAHSFQVSEDQSCVAVFHQYYYYACGLHAVYLSSKHIGKMTYSQYNDTSNSTSFSRIGGSKFAFHLSTNADVSSNRCLPIYVIDPDVENSTVGVKRQVAHHTEYPSADHAAGSTCYSGPFIMPVYTHWLDSTEYKELNA